MSERSLKERQVRYRIDPKHRPPPLSDETRAMSDEQIARRVASDPDAIDTSAPGFWDDAEVVLPEPKAQVTLRLDSDVLAWFRAGGKGYQTRINAVLRAYMNAQNSA